MESYLLQKMAGIAGSDLSATLDRFMNNQQLYRKFLIKFLDDATISNLQRSVEAGDLQEAFRFAHTLKGISGNLGLSSLFGKVSVMTEDLRGGRADHLLEQMREVRERYESVCELIREL